MIRYTVTLDDLREKIETDCPGWLERARTRTDEFRRKRKYEEESSIWSEVKPLYMRLQGESKCAYCERKLESVDLGKGEQDVEHFRPKGSVKGWKAPGVLTDAGIAFTAPAAGAAGYYLLPYHPFNYAAACKPCNSVLKKDYFPIAGAYELESEDPAALLAERPYLVYPLGDFDDRPEDLIAFNGLSPRPVARAGHPRHRALVTIEFFKLDDVLKRKNLFRERAMVIIALFPQLQKLSGALPDAERVEAEKLVDGFTSEKAPHTNCARSFRRLFESSPAQAREFFDKAVGFLCSIS